MGTDNRRPRVGFIYHEDCLKHQDWPERPERLTAIVEGLHQAGLWEQLGPITPAPLTEKELQLVHTPEYVRTLRDFCARGGGMLTVDTPVQPDSYRAAQLAAGGAVAATRLILEGKLDRAAAVVRPPGHHATPNQGMGFCLFNNVAIAARWALCHGGAKRVAVVDWDMHHGNGTQEAFFLDPAVLYVSLHEVPAYPGTGWYTEVGAGKGEGYTINIPMPPGAGDDCYRAAFESLIGPSLEAFAPDLILVSAGQDGHFADRMGYQKLTTSSFGWMTSYLVEVAGHLGHGRVAAVLEGGYDLPSLSASWNMITAALLGEDDGQAYLAAVNAGDLQRPTVGKNSILETVKERLLARSTLPLPPGTAFRRDLASGAI